MKLATTCLSAAALAFVVVGSASAGNVDVRHRDTFTPGGSQGHDTKLSDHYTGRNNDNKNSRSQGKPKLNLGKKWEDCFTFTPVVVDETCKPLKGSVKLPKDKDKGKDKVKGKDKDKDRSFGFEKPGKNNDCDPKPVKPWDCKIKPDTDNKRGDKPSRNGKKDHDRKDKGDKDRGDCQPPVAVPTPSAAVAGLSLLGLAGARRRRNR